MGSVDYAVLIAGLIKPLVTHPEAVVVNVEVNDDVLEELVGEQKNPKGSDAKC